MSPELSPDVRYTVESSQRIRELGKRIDDMLANPTRYSHEEWEAVKAELAALGNGTWRKEDWA